MSKTGDIVYSEDQEFFIYDNLNDLGLEVGDPYYKGVVAEIKPSQLVGHFTVDTILEVMEELLYEDVGELACGNLTIPKDKEEELLGIIKSYMDKNASVSCYRVDDIEECVVTKEDVE